jgi:hypothetical protein
MNTDTLANLDLISREIDQKDMEKEDIVRSAAYQINLARFKKQYPQFPAPTCMVGISGQWGRGKSTLFILLLRVWMEFDLFNEVFFFSGSGTKDPKMKHFFPHDNKSTRTTPENIMGLLESFEKDNPENKELLASVRSALMPKAPSPSSKGSKKNPVVAATAVKTGSGVSKKTGPKKSHRGPAPKDEFDEKKLRALIKQTLRSNKIKVSDIDSERFENMSKEEQCSFLRKMVSPGKICFFDDSSGDKAILSQNSPIYRLVIMLRHLGACCAFAYHSWKDLPKKMRKQTSTNIVFPCPPEEQEAIGMATDLGAKAMEFLLTAMGRIPHVYLVIHDRAPADEKYWINFRVPLSERTIGEIVSAEELFRKSQRGNNASNGFSLGGGDSSTGGSAIVQSLLDQAPEIDVLNKDRPLPSDKTLPLNLTSREQRLLPEARLLVAKVENFTYPLLPDPAKHLKKAAPPRKRRAPSSTTTRKKQKTTSATGTSQLLPSSHPMKDPIRPSSAQARTAAANFLHPSAVIANLARNRALAAGGRGISRANVTFAKAEGTPADVRAAVARRAAAKRNPKIAVQIAKSTTGRPNTQAVAAAFRRGLLQGIRGSRLSSRGLGPRRAAGRVAAKLRGSKRVGGRGVPDAGILAKLSVLQGNLSDQQTMLRAQAAQLKKLQTDGIPVPPQQQRPRKQGEKKTTPSGQQVPTSGPTTETFAAGTQTTPPETEDRGTQGGAPVDAGTQGGPPQEISTQTDEFIHPRNIPKGSINSHSSYGLGTSRASRHSSEGTANPSILPSHSAPPSASTVGSLPPSVSGYSSSSGPSGPSGYYPPKSEVDMASTMTNFPPSQDDDDESQGPPPGGPGGFGPLIPLGNQAIKGLKNYLRENGIAISGSITADQIRRMAQNIASRMPRAPEGLPVLNDVGNPPPPDPPAGGAMVTSRRPAEITVSGQMPERDDEEMPDLEAQEEPDGPVLGYNNARPAEDRPGPGIIADFIGSRVVNGVVTGGRAAGRAVRTFAEDNLRTQRALHNGQNNVGENFPAIAEAAGNFFNPPAARNAPVPTRNSAADGQQLSLQATRQRPAMEEPPRITAPTTDGDLPTIRGSGPSSSTQRTRPANNGGPPAFVTNRGLGPGNVILPREPTPAVLRPEPHVQDQDQAVQEQAQAQRRPRPRVSPTEARALARDVLNPDRAERLSAQAAAAELERGDPMAGQGMSQMVTKSFDQPPSSEDK